MKEKVNKMKEEDFIKVQPYGDVRVMGIREDLITLVGRSRASPTIKSMVILKVEPSKLIDLDDGVYVASDPSVRKVFDLGRQKEEFSKLRDYYLSRR